MTPTNKLRFLERETPVGITGVMFHVETILQQWWAVEQDGQVTPTGEWRDVPTEKEQTC